MHRQFEVSGDRIMAMGEQISENGELKSEDCKWGIVPLLRFAHYETVDIASQEVARCDNKPEGKHLRQMGKVTGLEFAQTFLMDREVVEYLPRLGTMPRMQRIQATQQSLYYRGNGKHSPKVLSFYDKEAEAKATGQDISTWVHEYGRGLLRYEMRLNGRLPHQLKEAEVCVSMLAQDGFYAKMVELYKQNYFSIIKQNNMETIVTSEIKKVSDAWDVWVARMMQQADTAQADEFMAELRRANVFKNKSGYTRLRKKMDGVIKKANVCVSDKLVVE